jgi:dienelactone hydrolase
MMALHKLIMVLIGCAAAVAMTGCSDGSDNGNSDGGSAGNADMTLGTYAVGVTTRAFVDATRKTPANGSEPEQPSRTLNTDIWYPTAGDSSSTATTRDAPLVGGPWPLVLFVHSSSGTRSGYTYLTTGLAHAGFVVAAADFPLTAGVTPGGPSDLHVTDQVGDLSFLCDSLASAASADGDLLKGAVVGDHYAVVGHSTGGTVAELAAWAGDDDAIKHDPRVSAVVPLSGDACMFDAAFFKKRTVPSLIIGGTDDLFVRLPNNGQWVFDNSEAPHLLAKLVGAQHVFFTEFMIDDELVGPTPTVPDSPLAVTLRAYGDASECSPTPPGGTDPKMPFQTQHDLTLQLVTAYLDAQLRQHPEVLASLRASNNPLIVFQE